MTKNDRLQILQIITGKALTILFLFVNGMFEPVHFFKLQLGKIIIKVKPSKSIL